MTKIFPAAAGIVLVSLLLWSSLAVAAPAAKGTPVPGSAATPTRAATRTPAPRKSATATPVPTVIDESPTSPAGDAPDLEVGAAAVTPITPGPMTSRIIVFNLDTNIATVGIKIYDSNGNAVGTISPFTIAPNGAVSKPLPSGITSPFSGSAVVSSDKNVQAFVTDSNSKNAARDEYGGMLLTDPNLILPFVRHLAANTQNTIIAVQNTGNAAADITLQLYNQDGTVGPSKTQTTVAPLASAYFNTNDISFPLGVFTGSAEISASGGVALAGSEETKYYKDTASFTALTAADGDTTLYLPFVERRRNATNGILSWDEIFVRNNGGSSTDITLTLRNASGATKATVTRSNVPGKGQAQFLLNTAEFAGLTGASAYFNGSAAITSSAQPITAYALDAQNSGLRLFGFSAIPLKQAGTKYACGDTFRIGTPSQYSKLNLANVGTASANVTVKLFKPTNGAGGGSKTYSIGPNKMVIANLSDSSFSNAGSNFEGLAIVTTSASKIVVSANTQYSSGGITSYNCMPLQ